MKYCNDYAALLDLFVDGELNPEEMADVQAHLDVCPGCRAYVDDAMAMRAAFPEVEDTVVPAGFAEGVMAAVAAAAPAKKPARKTPWLKVAMPLAACLAVVIVLQNGPATGGGGWAGGSSKAEAAPAAAPAAAESVMETTAEAPAAEAPAAMAPKAKAEPSLTAALADAKGAQEEAAPAEAAGTMAALPAEEDAGAPEPEMETGSSDASYNYAADFAVRAEVPAEAFRFLEGFPVAEETDTELHYHLTEAEYSTLQGQLAHARIAYIAEDGIGTDADTILVVLKK